MGIRFLAGIVLVASGTADMTDEGYRHRWQLRSCKEFIQQWDCVHITPIGFAIQKDAETVELVSRATLQSDQAAVASVRIVNEVLLQFDQSPWIRFLQSEALSLRLRMIPTKMQKESDGMWRVLICYRKVDLAPAMGKQPCLCLPHQFTGKSFAGSLRNNGDNQKPTVLPIRKCESNRLAVKASDPSCNRLIEVVQRPIKMARSCS